MPPRQVNFGICRFPGCKRTTLRVKRNDRHSNAYHKYCTTHGQRISHGLDPSKTPVRKIPAIDRIKLRSIKKDNGCIEYKYSLDQAGYGHICHNGDQLRASRFIWEYNNGKIPNGLLVCHKCDNPPCINIDHLFLGTYKDNNNDMINKNRMPLGENRAQSRLSNNNVIEIYRSKLKTKELMKKFNINRSHVNAIRRKVCWKSVLNNLKEIS